MNAQGDVLLTSTENGGEIAITDGLIQTTDGFETAIYLALFGGNYKDDGTTATKKYQYWGNLLETESQKKLTSRFQNLLYGIPATPANLLKLKSAALQDLSWLTTEKIADKINIDISIISKNRIECEIEVLKDETKLFETKFEANWRWQAA